MARKYTYKEFDAQNFGFFQPHIRFRGVWDMQDLYEFMINYFRERKYKFHERVYKHKHPSPFGAERQLVWRAERQMNDVYTFILDVYLHTYDAHDVQVKQKNGEIKTFTKGRLWVEFNGQIRIYPDERWAKSRFTAGLKGFINNYLKRKKHGWEMWDVVMYGEMQKIVWMTRRRLKMEYDEYEQKHWLGVHASG